MKKEKDKENIILILLSRRSYMVKETKKITYNINP
jgi:hypothetical protein